MNPSIALRTLSQRFLDQHEEDRTEYLDQIAERIAGVPGMDAPYPKTAKDLASRVSDLLMLAGKLERFQETYRKMDEFDLSGETLDGMAADMED